GLAQRALDRDGDGESSHLLGGDCDDTRADVSSAARDIPGNGIDENCSGKDARAYRLPRGARSEGPLPEPHDLVLLFVDALRPDRVGFGGYRRKTSPQL